MRKILGSITLLLLIIILTSCNLNIPDNLNQISPSNDIDSTPYKQDKSDKIYQIGDEIIIDGWSFIVVSYGTSNINVGIQPSDNDNTFHHINIKIKDKGKWQHNSRFPGTAILIDNTGKEYTQDIIIMDAIKSETYMVAMFENGRIQRCNKDPLIGGETCYYVFEAPESIDKLRIDIIKDYLVTKTKETYFINLKETNAAESVLSEDTNSENVPETLKNAQISCKSIDVSGFVKNEAFEAIQERNQEECLLELGAIFKNNAPCRDIKNKQRRVSCIALANNNPDLCNSDYFCIYQFINYNQNAKNACNAYNNKTDIDAMLCSAIVSDDSNKCPTSGAPGAQYYCRKYFAVKKADPAECAQAGKEEECLKEIQREGIPFEFTSGIWKLHKDSWITRNIDSCESIRKWLVPSDGITKILVLEHLMSCHRDVILQNVKSEDKSVVNVPVVQKEVKEDDNPCKALEEQCLKQGDCKALKEVMLNNQCTKEAAYGMSTSETSTSPTTTSQQDNSDSSGTSTSNQETNGIQTITVPGTTLWTNSGIFVNSGDTIRTTASGTVYFCSGNTCPSTPDGGVSPDPLDATKFPCFDGSRVSNLIGKIGNNACFNLNSAKEFIAQQSGTLFLGVNDGMVSDNSGSWTVNININ